MSNPLAAAGWSSSRQVQQRFGINRSTLARWIDKGWIKPAWQADGLTGTRYFTEDEIARAAALYDERKARRAPVAA